MQQHDTHTFRRTKGGALKKRKKNNKYDGIPVILLDYITGEYIDEYPSMSDAAEDLGIRAGTVVAAFSKSFSTPCIARIPRHEIMLMRKDAFIKLRESAPEWKN